MEVQRQACQSAGHLLCGSGEINWTLGLEKNDRQWLIYSFI